MEKKFAPHARVAFVGDSITTGGLFLAKTFAFYAEKFPEERIKMYNKGIPGDSAHGILSRLDADVFPIEPTEIVLMTGMNDVNRALYEKGCIAETAEKRKQAIQSHCDIMCRLMDIFVKKSLPVTLCSTSPCDEWSSLPTVDPMTGVGEAFEEMRIRDEENLQCEYLKNTIDFLTPMRELLIAAAQKGLPSFIGEDRVHPKNIGHDIMARILLRGQGFTELAAPSLESYENGSSALPALSPQNQARLDTEAILRILGFIEYHFSWGQEKFQTAEEKLAFWKTYYPEFCAGNAYRTHTGKIYLENKGKEAELYREMLRLTDAMYGD